MNLVIEQSIASTVTSTVTVAADAIQAKHKEEMLALQEMIEKFLLFKDSIFFIPSLDPNAFSKAFPLIDLQSKATDRQNQSNLSYFKPYLDKAYSESKIVSVGKDVYYRNVVLFVQRLQNLVTFKKAVLVKANIAMSLQGSTLEWYISKLNNFNRNTLNNDSGVKSQINTLFYYFKVPTSIAFSLLTNKTYSFDNTHI